MYVRQKCCSEQRDVFMCCVKAILVASSNLARKLAAISWRLVVIGEFLRESCQQPIFVFLSVTFWFKTHTLQLPLREDWKITLKLPRNRSRNGVKLTGRLNKWLLRLASLSQFPFDLFILPLTVACHVAHRARHAMVTEVTSVSLALFQNISWALHVSLNAQRGCSTARCLILAKLVTQLANRAVDQMTMTVTLVKVRNYYSLLRKTDLGFFLLLPIFYSPLKNWGGNWAELTFAKTSGTVARDRENLANSWPPRPTQKQLREISRFQFPSHSRSGELTYMYFEYTTSEKANHACDRFSASSKVNHVVDCLFFLTPWVILLRVSPKF